MKTIISLIVIMLCINSYSDNKIEDLISNNPSIQAITNDDNTISIQSPKNDKLRFNSIKKYNTPLSIKAEVMTDSNNIRIYFNQGMIIFGWEGKPNEVRYHDFATGSVTSIPNIIFTPNKYHTILIDISGNTVTIKLNNKNIYKTKGSYKNISSEVGISSALGSMITIKSLIITEGR